MSNAAADRKLGKLRGALHRVGRGALARKLRVPMAEAALAFVAAGFAGEHDPYGVPWAPLKHRRGKILRLSGRLARGFSRELTKTGFRLRNDVRYFGVHQGGATVTTTTRINAHARTGRFLSRATAAGRRRTVKTSVTHAHSFKIPPRPMVPDDRGLPPAWRAAFDRIADEAVLRAFR